MIGAHTSSQPSNRLLNEGLSSAQSSKDQAIDEPSPIEDWEIEGNRNGQLSEAIPLDWSKPLFGLDVELESIGQQLENNWQLYISRNGDPFF